MAINIVVQGDMKDELTGQCLEIIRQVRQKTGCPSNPYALKRELQKLIEGKFPEWPEGVTGVDIGEKYVALRFDSFTVKGHYLEFWPEAIRRYMDKLGVVPAESVELQALVRDGETRPISTGGIILGSIISIGLGEVISSMFTAPAFDKPYTHKDVILKDWLEVYENPISSGYSITYSCTVGIHDQFKDILGISLWFLCKRKTLIG